MCPLRRHWETAILRCLERDPRDRFASATEVVPALRGETLGPANQSRSWRRLALLAAAGLLLAVGGGVAIWMKRPTRATTGVGAAAPVAAARRSVAVLGFKDLSGHAEQAWLST